MDTSAHHLPALYLGPARTYELDRPSFTESTKRRATAPWAAARCSSGIAGQRLRGAGRQLCTAGLPCAQARDPPSPPLSTPASSTPAPHAARRDRGVLRSHVPGSRSRRSTTRRRRSAHGGRSGMRRSAHTEHEASCLVERGDGAGLFDGPIPQLEDRNSGALAASGFRFEPVRGSSLPDASRGPRPAHVPLDPLPAPLREPLYTPEPDLVHEVVGHAAALSSPGSPTSPRPSVDTPRPPTPGSSRSTGSSG